MKVATPRMRMFAGPNGSGKSTLKEVLPSALLGVYVNPDDMEKSMRAQGMLDFSAYQVHTDAGAVLSFLRESPLLRKEGLLKQIDGLRFADNQLVFGCVPINSYWASVLSDFIRHRLLESRTSFTFETVMSSPDKVAFLQKAREHGFRTYLYYVATEDPAINISRVEHRVRMGGHPVPEEKIVERYHRSLGLLAQAVRQTDRAYIFDNSSQDRLWLGEVTDGVELESKSERMPRWFADALWNRFGEEAQ